MLAVGNSEKAARLIGLSPWRLRLTAFAIMGALIGLGAVIWGAYYGKVQQNTGEGFELKVIAAAVVGGCSIMGGRGTALGAFLGAVLIALIYNCLVILKINAYWQGYLHAEHGVRAPHQNKSLPSTKSVGATGSSSTRWRSEGGTGSLAPARRRVARGLWASSTAGYGPSSSSTVAHPQVGEQRRAVGGRAEGPPRATPDRTKALRGGAGSSVRSRWRHDPPTAAASRPSRRRGPPGSERAAREPRVPSRPVRRSPRAGSPRPP